MAQQRDVDALRALRSYASDLVESAPPLEAASLHIAEGSPVPRRPHHLTAPAMAVVGVAAMLFFAEIGIAIGANGAVPGDSLYGIDLLVEDTLQAIGVPIDVASERMDEAEVLLGRDDLEEALRTARAGYAELDPPVIGGTIGHLVKAESVLASGADPTAEAAVRDALTDLLKATKDPNTIEVGDTRSISEAAQRVADAAAGDQGRTP